MVMEMMTGGELFDRIVEKGCYSETEAATVVHKILEGIFNNFFIITFNVQQLNIFTSKEYVIAI